MRKFFSAGTALLIGLFAVGVSSCSNDDMPARVNENTAKLAPEEYLTISYNGKKYANVPTAYDENGDFVFLDTEFSEIYNKELKNCVSMSVNLIGDNTIEIYKSLEENLTSKEISTQHLAEQSAQITRAVVNPTLPYIGEADLYDDKKFHDRNFNFRILPSETSIEHGDLNNPYKFNDKCSSLKVTNKLPEDDSQVFYFGSYTLKFTEVSLVFIGYDDKWYSDRTFTVIANANVVREYKELKNFNDKMSSFKMFFCPKGQYKTEGASK